MNESQKFTPKQIERAKEVLRRKSAEFFHSEHDDCILIAVEWLSSQRRTKKIPSKISYKGELVPMWAIPLKHIIESWAGRYVSQDDVEIAAHLLGLKGEYPYYNISPSLVRPKRDQLSHIKEAFKHPNYMSEYGGYKDQEWKRKEGSHGYKYALD